LLGRFGGRATREAAAGLLAGNDLGEAVEVTNISPHGPDLDIDLSVRSIERPEEFPLKASSA